MMRPKSKVVNGAPWDVVPHDLHTHRQGLAPNGAADCGRAQAELRSRFGDGEQVWDEGHAVLLLIGLGGLAAPAAALCFVLIDLSPWYQVGASVQAHRRDAAAQNGASDGVRGDAQLHRSRGHAE
jgi:hypothetical protein